MARGGHGAGEPVSDATPGGTRLEAVLASAFTPAVLFVSAANNIILKNLRDLPYHGSTVRLFLYAFLVTWAAAAAVFVAAPRVHALERAARAWLLAGVAVFLFQGLTAVYGGGAHAVSLMLAGDLVAVGVAGLVVFRARFASLLRTFAVVAVVLAAVGVAQHVLTLQRQRALAAQEAKAIRAKLAAVQTRAAGLPEGNVYHIILDAFQTEAFLVLAQQEPELEMDGFTLYPEFTAHYARTNHSVPNLLAGRFYRSGESMWEYRTNAIGGNGLWADLAAAGVGLHLYPHYPPYCTELTNDCHDTMTFAEAPHRDAGALSPRDVTIDLWFQSVLPPSLRTALNRPFVSDPRIPHDGAHNYGFSVVRMLSGPPAEAATHQDAGPVAPFNHPAAHSVRNFDRMLEHLGDMPARGQYVFFHAIVPHWPFVVDEQCRYTGLRPGVPPLEQYLDQSRCGLVLIERLVARLKELGRFEDALIIVHGDHGGKGGAVMLREAPDQWPGPDYGSDLTWPNGDEIKSEDWPSHMVDLYRHGLLLVKKPGAHGFERDDTPVEMNDLAPTILAHFGASVAGYPGIPLDALTPGQDRELVFFASSARPNPQVPEAFSKYVYEDGRWVFREDYATAP